MLQERMAGLAQPQFAVGVQGRGGHGERPAHARFGGDEIKMCHQVDGEAQRPSHSSDLRAQAAQDTANLLVFFTFDDGALGAQVSHPRRFNVYRLAGTAGAMHDALQFMAMIDGHRQDVMVSAHRGIGKAKDAAQLRIAQQALDLVLHALVHFG